MFVADVVTVTQSIPSCGPETSAAIAAEIMWTRNCGVLPVLDDRGRIQGMVTGHDLFLAAGAFTGGSPEPAVGDLMHWKPESCKAGDSVLHAIRMMTRLGVHRLPVVDETGALQGILSLKDLLSRVSEEPGEGLANELVRLLNTINPILCEGPCECPSGSEGPSGSHRGRPRVEVRVRDGSRRLKSSRGRCASTVRLRGRPRRRSG